MDNSSHHRRLTMGMQILIADDQTRARQSLKALLATWPTVERVREASNGQEAIRLVEEATPDVVVMDARMPEMDGVQATRVIKQRWPRIKVVVWSMYPEYEAEAQSAGADAFVTKGEPPQQLLARIEAVMANRTSSLGDREVRS
jgi:DNA-binding NarL/FixJ family response regulator